ncbi:MAG: sigma-70 family RNA polymerase sigma factor [Blastopirellula sp. JB062]
MNQRSTSQRFTEQITVHRRQLYAFIYSLVSSHADAEDIYQRSCMVIWEKFDEYDPERGFLPWAMGIAFYETKNFMRRSSRDRHHFSEKLVTQLCDQTVAGQDDEDLFLASLEGCLKRLPEDDLQLIHQVYWERTDFSSLAKDLGILVNSLYDRLWRLRTRLKKCISLRLLDGERHGKRS